MYRCVGCATEYSERVGWCWLCLDVPWLVPAGRRPQSRTLHASPTRLTARELAAQQWDLLTVPATPGLRLMRGALVVVMGAPGAGKSTLALRMADSMRGPSVVLLAEEQPGPAVGERLHRCGIRSSDLYLLSRASVDAIADTCREVRARVLVVDSIQATTLQADDLRALLGQLGLDALLAVSQVTRAGTIRGARTIDHEADVVIDVEAGRWRAHKSRYSAAGEEGQVHVA